MKILIVTSSGIETNSILKTYENIKSSNEGIVRFQYGNLEIELLQTQPGIFSMSYMLAKYLNENSPELAINAGICGSFSKDVKPGDAVFVTEDIFADFGAESSEGFLDFFQIGLYSRDEFPFHEGLIQANPGKFNSVFQGLKEVKGITVNKVSGTVETIDFLMKKYSPQVESMEGAAFYYVCSYENLNFAQLRTVSNHIEVRDKSKWDIPLALENLNRSVFKIIEFINE